MVGASVRAGHALPVPCRPVPVAETLQGGLWVPTASTWGTPRYPGTQRTVNGPTNGQRGIASRPLTVSGVADRHRRKTHEAPALFKFR